jgi:hypothetical protein
MCIGINTMVSLFVTLNQVKVWCDHAGLGEMSLIIEEKTQYYFIIYYLLGSHPTVGTEILILHVVSELQPQNNSMRRAILHFRGVKTIDNLLKVTCLGTIGDRLMFIFFRDRISLCGPGWP